MCIRDRTSRSFPSTIWISCRRRSDEILGLPSDRIGRTMRIMISCGEASGDMYAGALAAELRQRAPDAEIFGFGGPRLQQAGGRLVGHYGPFAVTGLTEAVKVVPRSFAMLRKLVDAARELRPHVFVLSLIHI